MEKSEELKEMVRGRYTQIAGQDKLQNSSSFCGEGGCGSPVTEYTVFSDNYEQIAGYVPEADLGLGCGLPTEHALIREGDTVVDLGSGAGNDCFVARSLTGETGRVIGIDFTEAMIDKARANAVKLGYSNVQFRYGDIEKMPLTSSIADVVISNCVLNLIPDKRKAFSEIFRILKPGGHFSISDVVLQGKLPDKIAEAAVMYAGCVSGALQKADYLDIIQQSGFSGIIIQKQKTVSVPEEILLQFINTAELEQMKKENTGIFSLTVYAEKPKEACGCGCGCNS